MKLKLAFVNIFIFSLSFLIGGCGATTELPDNPIIYSHGVVNGYTVLRTDDREYIPFCDVGEDYIGECIGYCDVPVKDAEPVRHYIYSMTGRSEERWIIEIDSNKVATGLLYREAKVEDVPDGLQQEYNPYNEKDASASDVYFFNCFTYTYDNGVYVVNGNRVFDYKIELTGHMPNAKYDTKYVVLTNNPDISFEEVSRSQYSSNLKDLLRDTIIIGMQTIGEDRSVMDLLSAPKYRDQS